MTYTIVFIHIGQKLPGYLSVALQQARLFNRTCRIILIASAEAIITSTLNRNLNIEVVPCEALGLSDKHQEFLETTNLDRPWRDSFSLRTTERFYYLETLMKKMELRHVFHLENDSLLYVNIATLLPIFQAHYPGIAATFDAPSRCVPGFVYIEKVDALASFTQFTNDHASQPANIYTDMTLLALFKQKYGSPLIDFLPIVTSNYPYPLQSTHGCKPQNIKDYANHFNEFKSIFDAAAIGQYLGGVDPANRDDKDTTGFINETSVFNPSFYKYDWHQDQDKRRIPVAISDNEVLQINNLHIHSKKLELFAS